MKIIFLAWKFTLVLIGIPVVLCVSFLVYEKLPSQHYQKYKNEALIPISWKSETKVVACQA
ncbi:hypothetical protein ACX27_16985 [Nostoc piscinale CENA21]|uniref:Uncharacterized protein n=1 Tax=Nostoc piscinale CENA21 TaxID=224013 RepID=A0A0M3V5R9_9NOSO|nr:hypothetical protein ACX27_16985 [Nostoc piscinale CENA21]